MADAGRRRPASAEFQEADSASCKARRSSCKARRSSSVRSSPSSSATKSDRPVWQRSRLVEHEAPLLDVRPERAHVATVRLSTVSGKQSRTVTRAVDLFEPSSDLRNCPLFVRVLAQTGPHVRGQASQIERDLRRDPLSAHRHPVPAFPPSSRSMCLGWRGRSGMIRSGEAT
jgi:hypothetical protein